MIELSLLSPLLFICDCTNSIFKFVLYTNDNCGETKMPNSIQSFFIQFSSNENNIKYAL